MKMRTKIFLILLAGMVLFGVSKVNSIKATNSNGQFVWFGSVDLSDSEEEFDEEFDEEVSTEEDDGLFEYLVENFRTPFTKVIEED